MLPASELIPPSADRRTFSWEWTQVGLLAANLIWTTLCLGGFRPATMVVTSLLTGLLLTVHLLARADAAVRRAAQPAGGEGQRVGSVPTHAASWFVLPFLLYAAANVVWVTPVPWIGWRDWFGWAQLAAVFWVTLNGVRTPTARVTLLAVLFALGTLAVVLGAYQRFVQPDWLMLGRTQVPQFVGRASGPFGIPNSLAALLLLLLPPACALMLRRGANAVQRVLSGYLALVFLFGLGLTVSRGAWLSLAVVLVAWPWFHRRGSWRRRLGWAAVIAVAIALAAGTAFLRVDLVRERWSKLRTDGGELSRPILWRGAWQIFAEHPAWGSGAGSFAVAFEKHRPADFQDDPLWAHNDYLNTLSDYGAVGFALCFGGWAGILWAARRARRRAKRGERLTDATAAAGAHLGAPFDADELRRGEGVRARTVGSVPPALESPTVRRGLGAGLVAFALQLFVDFHFKIPALALAFGVVAALYVRAAWPQREMAERGDSRAGWPALGWAVAALAVMVGIVAHVLPRYRAEAYRYEARRAIDRLALRQTPVEQWRPVLVTSRSAFERANRIDPTNGAAWADLAYVKALFGWIEPERRDALAIEAEHAAGRALGCSTADPEFWIRRGVALDMRRHHLEAGAAFTRAVVLAPARARAWYHLAFHLSLLPAQRARALAAVEFCLRLDGGNREAQALRRRLTESSRAP